MLEKFYPFIPEAANKNNVTWQWVQYIKLESLLEQAQQGNKRAECHLCNMVGQLHRSVNIIRLEEPLRELSITCIKFLRTVGRVVNLDHTDPRYWITKVDGTPRW